MNKQEWPGAGRLVTEQVGGNLIVVRTEGGLDLGTFEYGEDGYLCYWPCEERHGSWSAEWLRAIADRLDEMNSEWHARVCADLARNVGQQELQL